MYTLTDLAERRDDAMGDPTGAPEWVRMIAEILRHKPSRDVMYGLVHLSRALLATLDAEEKK